MKTRLLLCFFLSVIFVNQSPGQQVSRFPKNSAGVFAGVEWNTLSGLWGVEYQRTLPAKGQALFGISGVFVPSYNIGNAALFSGRSEEDQSKGLLLATGTFFTSKTKQKSGFFLHTGIGMGFTQRKLDEIWISRLHTAGDVSIGWYIPFDASTGLKIEPSLLFASSGGITRLKMAFDF